MIPATHSIIEIETNSLGNSDGANWIGSMVLEAFLDVPMEDRNDYLKIAEEAKKSQSMSFPHMLETLEEGRHVDVPIRPLQEYIGRYYNRVHTNFLDIYEVNGSLWMCRGGDKNEADSIYQLKAYNEDTFSWAIDYYESCRRGLWPNPTPGFYLLHFMKTSQEGAVNHIVWKHSPSVPEGEIMLRNSHESHLGKM